MIREKSSDWSILEKFFLFCSGTDAKILKDCSKGIKGKYIALGWLVLTPAVLALWSGSYFFSTIFKNNISLSIFFGLIWALIILNIDRYLIITFEKGSSVFRDIFSFSVISRLIIAVFIAYVIAHPIVLRLFSNNIDEYIYSQNEVKKEDIRNYYNKKIEIVENQVQSLNREINEKANAVKGVNTLPENHEISNLRKDIAVSAKEISNLRIELNKSHEDLSDEISGKSSRTGKKGYGQVARTVELKIASLNSQIAKAEELHENLEQQLKNTIEKEKANNKLAKDAYEFEKTELAALEARNLAIIKDKQSEILRIRALADNKISGFDEKASNDFLARSNALEELSRENYNVKKWSYLLTIIFILLDVLPILWKVIPRKDAYDLKLETYRISAENFETVERKAIDKMKIVREQTALKLFHYENVKHEMGHLCNHKSDLLKMFNNFYESKVFQDHQFIERIKQEKAESESISDLDNENRIEDSINKIIRGYFNHTSGMTSEMVDFLNNDKENEHPKPVLVSKEKAKATEIKKLKTV
ncbi:DUF4407 [Desulfonema limicola]|uniref:DUF4407 n=1 Tax=Desulfonema limicola TaxID=45656 RepID=A0A975BBP9_9BACT|nr:DUF4407 domain-containing protein [Desulfonema limicola]QTA82310.1 DUF4407 [Desulfonema limicola]